MVIVHPGHVIRFVFVPILKLYLTIGAAIGGNVAALIPSWVITDTIQMVPIAFLHDSIRGWVILANGS